LALCFLNDFVSLV